MQNRFMGDGLSWLLFTTYDVVLALAIATVLIPTEVVRIILGRSRIELLRERLGTTRGISSKSHPFLLVHAVSVGEMAAARSLIASLKEEISSVRFILTTGNREGRMAAEQLRKTYPEIAEVRFLPWDRHAATRRWMQRINPSAVIVIETEIWPNLFRSADELSIPLFIVSGRIYPKDRSRYRFARRFFRSVLASVEWIGVQSEQERSSFIRAGAPVDRVEVVGNLKHDTIVSHGLPRPWEVVFEQPNGAPLIVAGSTHYPEEAWLIEALNRLRQNDLFARLVLAPRHPGRADAVHHQVVSAGWATARWSDGPPADGSWEVLILDQVGPLAAVYQWADVAVIGGSLVRRGGHNPLEAAQHSQAIVIGPHHEHFSEIVHGLDQVGGIRVLPQAGDVRQALFLALRELMQDSRQREEMGRHAFAYVRNHHGIARRYARTLVARI